MDLSLIRCNRIGHEINNTNTGAFSFNIKGSEGGIMTSLS
jgi:hypothetical protein